MDRVQALCGGKGKGHAIVWDIEKAGRRKGYCYNCSRTVTISYDSEPTGDCLNVECTRDKPFCNTQTKAVEPAAKQSEDLSDLVNLLNKEGISHDSQS